MLCVQVEYYNILQKKFVTSAFYAHNKRMNITECVLRRLSLVFVCTRCVFEPKKTAATAYSNKT